MLDLSPRQRDVALQMAYGLSNAEIGEALDMTGTSVVNHVRYIIALLGCKERKEAVRLLAERIQELQSE